MKISIIPLTKDDNDLLTKMINLYKEIFKDPNISADSNYIYKLLNRPVTRYFASRIFIAIKDPEKDVLGFIFAHYIEPDLGYIEYIGVKKAFRRKRIATSLLNSAEKWLLTISQSFSSELRYILAEIEFNNEPSILFFLKHGYSIIDFCYIQPRIRKNANPVPMFLIIKPFYVCESLNKNELLRIVKQLLYSPVFYKDKDMPKLLEEMFNFINVKIKLLRDLDEISNLGKHCKNQFKKYIKAMYNA